MRSMSASAFTEASASNSLPPRWELTTTMRALRSFASAMPLLRAASGTQLLRLAAVARPVTLKAGVDPLANVIEPSLLVVLTGTITITLADGTTQSADSGDTIGMYQALSGKPLGATLSPDTDGTALRFTRTDLFDVLADETALIQSVFAGLLKAADRRAREPQPA